MSTAPELIAQQDREQVRSALPQYKQAESTYAQAIQKAQQTQQNLQSAKVQRSITDLNQRAKVFGAIKNVSAQQEQLQSTKQEISSTIPELERLSNLQTPQEYQAQQEGYYKEASDLLSQFGSAALASKYASNAQVKEYIQKISSGIGFSQDLANTINTTGIPANLQSRIESLQAKGLSYNQAFSNVTGLRLSPSSTTSVHDVNIQTMNKEIQSVPDKFQMVNVVSKAPTFFERYKSVINPTKGDLPADILKFIPRTFGFFGDVAGNKVSSSILRSKDPYQAQATGNLAGEIITNAPYFTPAGPGIMILEGAGNILSSQTTLGQKGIGVVETGLGIFGIKGQLAQREANQLNKAIANEDYKTTFKGQADDNVLKVQAVTDVQGRKVDTLMKYSKVELPSGENIYTGNSLQRVQINPNEYQLTGYKNLGQAKVIDGSVKNIIPTNVKGFGISEFVNPINNAQGYFSNSASKNMGTIFYNTKSTGMLDIIGETPSSKLAQQKVGQNFDSLGMITKSKSAVISQRIENRPVKFGNDILGGEIINPETKNVYSYLSGKTKLKQSKDFFFKKSLVFKPTIYGEIEFKPQLSVQSVSGNNLISVFENKAPIDLIRKDVQRSVSEKLSPELLALQNKVELSQLAKSGGLLSPILKNKEVSVTTKSVQNVNTPEIMKSNRDMIFTPVSRNIQVETKDSGSLSILGNANQQSKTNIQNQVQDKTKEDLTDKAFRNASLNMFNNKNRNESQTFNEGISTTTQETSPKPPFIFGFNKKPSTSDIKSLIGKIKKYKIFSRTKNKDVQIGTATSEKEAAKVLFGNLKTTLRAGGFISENGQRVNLSKYLSGEFIPSKKEGVFRAIQKNKFRLGTSGERKEIQYFKKTKSKKKRLSWW